MAGKKITGKNLLDAAKDAKDGATKAAKGAVKKAAQVADATLDTASDAVGEVTKKARGAAAKAANVVENTAEGAVSTAKKVAKKAKDVAEDVVEDAAGAVKNVADKAGDIAQGAATKAKGAAKKAVVAAEHVVSDAGAVVGEAVDKVQDLAEGAVGAVGNVAHDAVDLAKDTAGKIGGAGAAAIGAGVAAIGGAGAAASGLIGDTKKSGKFWPILLILAIAALAIWAFGKIGQGAGATPTKAAAEATDANGLSANPDAVECGAAFNEAMADQTIKFESSKAFVSAESQDLMNRLSSIASSCSGFKIEIAGHTDATGLPEANMALSQARADAVKAYMVDKGVPETILSAKGYGATKLLDTSNTSEAHAKNRRTEFIVQ